MNFRKVKASDREQVLALFNECLLDLIRREGIDEPGLLVSEVQHLSLQMDASIQHQGPVMSVAESGGMVLGTFALLPLGRFSSFLSAGKQLDCEIGCVYVAPVCQRAGVGKFLFFSVLEHAKKRALPVFRWMPGFPVRAHTG